MTSDTWRFGVVQFEPMLTVDEDGSLRGLSSHIIRHLSKSFNVSYEMVNSPDGHFGTKQADGNWSGIMGSIQRGEADIFGVPITSDFERLEIVYYSCPIHTSYFIIASALKTRFHQNYWGLLTTFDLEVWLGVFVSIASLIGLSLFVDATLGDVLRVKVGKARLLSDYFWNYLAAFFSEGSPINPTRGINKWLLFVWCVAVLTLMNAFTGHFKSRLTIVAEPKQIENAEDLAEEPDDLKVMIWGGSSFEVFVRTTDLPAYDNIERKADKNGGFINVRDYYTWENYEDTVNGKSAFMVETTVFNYFLGLMCSVAPDTKIHLTKEPIYAIHAYIPYTKRFSEEKRRAIDGKLYQFVETGLTDKWKDDITGNSGKCTEGTDTSTVDRTLGFSDLKGVFVSWLCLLGFAILVFLAELLLKPKQTLTKSN